MVTVIATKEELTIPVKNGLTGSDSNDNERPFPFIKDYQEVDFHRLVSCKPFPDDLFGRVDGQILKSSIKGTFFVQIDGIEPCIQIIHQNEQTNDNNRLFLTITDGIRTVKAIANGHIPSLNFNTKIGSKLLLIDTIPIQDGLLQLTHDNTQYQYGSNTYSRARSTRRGHGSGSYRSSYEGRRNSRYDNDDGETNFFKRPPPKNTLMDFMTSLKLSNDNENEKSKEGHDNHKRRFHNEQNNGTNSTNKINSQPHYSLNNNNNNYNETVQQDETDEQIDPEDDPSHANHRERRNPLPPRLQRVQEERSRRNTNRYYDESILGNDLNSIYSNDTISNQALSSSSYIRHGDQTSYIPNGSSSGPQHTNSINAYAQPTNIIAGVSSSTPNHLTYFQAPSSLTYNLAGIPSPSFHNHQALIGPSYANDHLTFCYGAPYGTPSYLPSTITNNYNGDTKHNGTTHSDNETTTSAASQNDENNDSGIKSETSTSEQKQTPLSSNDSNTTFQEEKHRDSNLNLRHRWRVGDMCLARWSDDGEFYYATVVDIQSSFCTVMYHDYNNYEQVRFSDLKVLPRDQQYYSLIHPTSDFNILAANTYFPPRTNYYPTTLDGCIMMPEPPPFPFNSAGTLYMYPTQIPSRSRSDRYNTNGFQQQIQPNENIDSLSPSNNSNDTSGVDSTTTMLSSNDEHQQQDSLLPQPCSITDAPLVLVSSDELSERCVSAESLTSSKYDEEQLAKEEEEGTKK
ncbi:unnamed protein product [Rotaria socialis]|uniref:Tudor domain-containing protein n=1 Tax=Rotaria socialis TaxID=392032 RepID=A0A818A8P6_9BILA|nr:unnamed protein product [Rotaria socialis]